MCALAGNVLGISFDEKGSLTQEFADASIIYKCFYMLGSLHLMMQLYFVGWCLMDVGPIATGLAFNGYDGEAPRWDRVSSVNIWNIMFSSRCKDFLANWNISAHNWLKHYIFMRMLPTGKRGQGVAEAAFMTFIVSATWHGYYPGFFGFFIGAGILDYQGKLFEEGVVSMLDQNGIAKKVIDVLMWFNCYIFCAYFAQSFI